MLPKVDPMIPKLGDGVAGEASCKVNLYIAGQYLPDRTRITVPIRNAWAQAFGIFRNWSSQTYHHVFVTPKKEHPTVSQYAFALSMEGTAKLRVGPLTGQPVSVIQTGFPPTADLV